MVKVVVARVCAACIDGVGDRSLILLPPFSRISKAACTSWPFSVAASAFLACETENHISTIWPRMWGGGERRLEPCPRDVGCERAVEVLESEF
jgi:hypothetical protein